MSLKFHSSFEIYFLHGFIFDYKLYYHLYRIILFLSSIATDTFTNPILFIDLQILHVQEEMCNIPLLQQTILRQHLSFTLSYFRTSICLFSRSVGIFYSIEMPT